MSLTICSVPLLSALFASCAPPLPFATGYVEGEYVLVAPVETTEIATLLVARGDHLETGAPLAELDRATAEIALGAAEANLARAEAELADLHLGKRPEEIAVIEAALASARAQANEARRTALRLASLAEKGSATETQREDAATAAEIAAARVAEIEADLTVARLPARPHTIAAAEAQRAAAKAERDRAAWALSKRSLTAPAAGTVYDIIRTAGEIAGPAQPVLSFLPDGAVKLRLYMPAENAAAIAVGSALSVRCDGCPDGLAATVTYVSDAPEFTPPVIYSLENRQKFVYLVEARPIGDGTSLKPGQIVDVLLPGAAE